MKCDNCGWDYPSEYLAPLVSTTRNVANCCGICALELTNQIHGINRKKFDGQIAESVRLKAVEWRKKHATD